MNVYLWEQIIELFNLVLDPPQRPCCFNLPRKRASLNRTRTNNHDRCQFWGIADDSNWYYGNWWPSNTAPHCNLRRYPGPFQQLNQLEATAEPCSDCPSWTSLHTQISSFISSDNILGGAPKLCEAILAIFRTPPPNP